MASGLEAEASDAENALEARLARRSTWTPEVSASASLEIGLLFVRYRRKTSDISDQQPSQEDARLLQLVSDAGPMNWSLIAQVRSGSCGVTTDFPKLT